MVNRDILEPELPGCAGLLQSPSTGPAAVPPVARESPAHFPLPPMPDSVRIFHFCKPSGYNMAVPWCFKICVFLNTNAYHLYICLLALWLLFLKYLVFIAHFYIRLFAFLWIIHKISINIKNTKFFVLSHGLKFFSSTLRLVFLFH